MGYRRAQRVIALCLVVVAWGCARLPQHEPAVVRGSGLPPTTLVAPFRPWAGSAPMPAGGLLADGEHGPAGQTSGLETLDPPTVTKVDTDWRGRLRVSFNREVCPADEKAPSVLTLTPTTEGSAHWESADSLVFVPTRPWPSATPLSVHVGAKLCSTASLATGQRVDTVYRPLHHAYVNAPSSLAKQEAFRVGFTENVSVSAVHAGVLVEELDDAGSVVQALPVVVRVATPKNKTTIDDTFFVEPQKPWPRDRRLRVSIGARMRGLGGAPLEHPDITVLRTWGPQQVTAACSREVSHEDCTPGLADARGLEVAFGNPLAQKAVAGVVVSPRPKGLRMSLSNPDRLVITGDFELGETYKVTIPAGLRDRFGQRTADKTTLRYEIGLPPPSITLGVGPDRAGDARTSASMRVDRSTFGITTRRLQSVRLRVAKVPDEKLADYTADRPAVVAKGLATIVDETLTLTPTGPTQFSSTGVNLETIIGKHRGALVITVSAGDLAGPTADKPDDAHLLVQVGDLGLTVGESSAHGHEIRVASLVDGRPIAGAEIAVVVTNESTTTRRVLGTTNANGHLHVAPQTPTEAGASIIVVARGPSGDEAVLEVSNDWGQPTRQPDALLAPNESLLGHVVTERGIYKPGETIHLVAWTKIGSPNVALGRRAIPEGTELVAVLETDEVLSRKTVKVNAHGKIVTSFALDAEAKPGHYTVKLLHRPTSQQIGSRTVRVEHYQTPAFLAEVIDAKRDGLSRATFRVTGKHYSGDPLDIVGATVTHTCYGARPDREHFGLGQGWDVGYWPDSSKSLVTTTATTPTLLQPAREITVRLDASAVPSGRSEWCGVKADLLDRTLQSQANGSSPRVSLYGSPEAVALQVSTPKRKGERRIVTVRSVMHVGSGETMKRIRWPEPVEVVLVQGDERTTVCTLQLGDRGDARCRLGKLDAWAYDVEVRDKSGLLASTRLYAHSWSTPTPEPAEPKRDKRCASFRGVQQCHEVDLNPEFGAKTKVNELVIAPETSSVLVGEQARIAVRGPYQQASGLLIVRTVGASQTVPFTMTAGRAEVVADVRPSWESGVELMAWVTPPPTAKTTATHHQASARLDVLDRDRELKVTVAAPATASVRETKPIVVTVTDPAGKPVEGRVAIWVSDRAVLDLTGYRLPSVWELTRHPELGSMSVIERYGELTLPFLPRKEGIYFVHGTGTGQGFGSGHGRLGGSHHARAPRMRAGAASVEHERSNFQTTPLFVGDVATDAQGRATVELKLPDNITEFVVLAVASSTLDAPGIPERFGTGRASIVVNKALVLTAALPQHMRPGDQARVAAVVRNNGTAPVDVNVTAAVEGSALSLSGEDARRVTIPAGTDRRVSFEVIAAGVGTGKVRLQAIASGALNDAVVLPLTVADERLRYEEDGTQGVLVAVETPDERGVTVPVELAKGIEPQTVEARLSFGRSPITGLEAAAASLMRFPYGCVEQLSSKLVPLIAVDELRDLGLVDENPDTFIGATVSEILDHQRPDGGFGLWSSTDDAHDYGSAWATWVLVQAHRSGVKVKSTALTRAIDFAKAIYDRDAAPEARALAMLAIAEHGESISWVTERLAQRASGELPKGAFELGMLAMSLKDAPPKTKERMLKALMAMLVVRGDQAGVAGPALAHGAPMGTRVPGTAAIMMGLMALDPKSPILQKMATGLLAQRHRGHWPATQDNAFALLALSRYARLVGKPVAVRTKGWVGTKQVIDEGLSDEAPVARGAWTALDANDEAQHITIQRIGTGPVHYMLRVRRMRAKGEVPKSRVLSLNTTLRTASATVGDSVIAGQVLALDVEWHTSQPVSYVAIDVPVPAGLEPAIAGLRTKVDSMLGDTKRAESPLVSHFQAYPDRVVIFVDRVPPGTHKHTIYVRAVTPGTYDFPAARAMAQYAPAVQGWTTSRKLTVADRTK